MELLVIDDQYPADYLAAFKANNIKYPKEGEIVTLLRVIKFPRTKQVGFIVQPYENQYLPVKNFGIESTSELSFNSKRFVHLDKREITEEEINEFKKNKHKELVIVPLKEKEEKL